MCVPFVLTLKTRHFPTQYIHFLRMIRFRWCSYVGRKLLLARF